MYFSVLFMVSMRFLSRRTSLRARQDSTHRTEQIASVTTLLFSFANYNNSFSIVQIWSPDLRVVLTVWEIRCFFFPTIQLQCCFHSFEFSWFHHTFLHSPNDLTCVLFSLQVFVSPVSFVWTCLCVFLYKIELILQKLNSLASTTTSDESNLEFTHSFLHRKKVCWTTFLFYCNIFVFVVFLLNDVFFYSYPGFSWSVWAISI